MIDMNWFRLTKQFVVLLVLCDVMLAGRTLICKESGRPDCKDNFAWVTQREGGMKLVGYIPTPRSGVTIGVGIDLGQQSEEDLQRLKVPASIIVKVHPYLGLKTAEEVAKKGLKPENLKLSLDEAQALTFPFLNEDLDKVTPYCDNLSCNGTDVLVSLRHWAGSLGNSHPDGKLCVEDPPGSRQCQNFLWQAIKADTATDKDIKTALGATLNLLRPRSGAYNRVKAEISHL